jgi:hypothetical protein
MLAEPSQASGGAEDGAGTVIHHSRAGLDAERGGLIGRLAISLLPSQRGIIVTLRPSPSPMLWVDTST